MVTDLPLLSISSCCTCAGKRASPWAYGTTARAPRPRKLTFHTPRSAMTAGMLCARGAVKKWRSTERAPLRNERAMDEPRANASGSKPADAHDEYRPPTQFQNSKSRSSRTPKSRTAGRADRPAHAVKCAPTMSDSGMPRPWYASRIHWRTFFELRVVSAVANDLEQTTTSVSRGSRPRVAASKFAGSTFATKDTPNLVSSDGKSSACTTNSGPRCEPPMPTTTTCWNWPPVGVRTSPRRTASANSQILCRTANDCATASFTDTPPSSSFLVSTSSSSSYR
mmetsp:Transcript_22991/g.70651  ORF Transcript_22991/g.70651 Transcript_22991/m.70651 type:complete len:281 (+) Transcript_22991:2353-3195(+)